ncbi:MAG: isoaspartyl peptidase/L-asparaginase [Bacteroidota bacterium]
MTNKKFSIAVHGGAGTILKTLMTEKKEQLYSKGLQVALEVGYDILEDGGSSLDAVEAAVYELENFPLFNAGKGAVFTHDGKHEMDASIMDGKTLKAGAVTCVQRVRNPVVLAREVMEHSEHVLLSGKGAEQFAKIRKVKLETDKYFFTDERYNQLQEVINEEHAHLDHSVQVKEKKFGTVGAVALDENGNLAAATSTGGMTNKRFGRIGDSPIIGSGTYANNNTCAISCTGHGEFFIRAVVAYDISCLMEYKGMTLKEACEEVVNKKLKRLGGEGGLIAIDQNGNIELPFNSLGMYRGLKSSDGNELIAIYK